MHIVLQGFFYFGYYQALEGSMGAKCVIHKNISKILANDSNIDLHNTVR